MLRESSFHPPFLTIALRWQGIIPKIASFFLKGDKIQSLPNWHKKFEQIIWGGMGEGGGLAAGGGLSDETG